MGAGLCSEPDTFFFSNLYMLWGHYDDQGELYDVRKLQEHGNHSDDCEELLLSPGESFTSFIVFANDERIFALGLGTDQQRQIVVGDPG